MWIHAKRNDDPALRLDGQTVTYAELHEKIDKMMYLLSSNKLTGMRIAIDLPESFTLLQWVAANWNVGNSVMLLDQRLKTTEKEWRLADYSPDMLISSLTYEAGGIHSFQPEVPVQIQDYDIDRRYRVRGQEDEYALDPALLVLYSSGSTGIPKQIIRTTSSLKDELHHYGQEPHAPETHSSVLCLAPVTHAYGLLSACLHTLHVGGVVHLPSVLRPHELARQIEQAGITHVYGVQFHYQLLEKAWRQVKPLLHKPICISSGGALSPELAERYRELGMKLTEQYGMSEVGYIAVDFTGRSKGAVGPIADHHRWRVDSDGQLMLELPRSPYASEQENWLQQEQGGWLSTQDLVGLDGNHFITLRGRMNRQVSIGGLKVNLEEVEARLAEHPHIAQCCVVGNMHPVYGTYLEAFVVWNESGELPFTEIKAWLAAGMADYKIPKAISVVQEIPTSPSGKVLRGELIKGSQNDYQTTS